MPPADDLLRPTGEALRREPGRENLVALYHDADRACRWIYWPMYQWTRWVQHMPGQQFGVWAAVIGLYLALSAAGAPRWAVGGVLIPYAILVLYTWLATPLVKAWTKLRRPG